MSILNYFKTLLPSLEKRTIMEDINNSLGELRTATLPILKSSQEVMGAPGYKFKSKDLIAFNTKFSRDSGLGSKENYIATIYKVAQAVDENGYQLLTIVDKMFSTGMVGTALTYRKASVLKYVEAISFFQRYARRLINQAYLLETAATGGNVHGATLSVGEMKWMKEKEDLFIGCMKGLSTDGALFHKLLEETPDVIINPDNATVVNEMSGGKTDPFKMNFIATWLNPIYGIRMRIADYQNVKYEAALQERKTIELRILQMKNGAEGKQDARLDQMIEYNSGRLDKLNFKIKKMEEGHE